MPRSERQLLEYIQHRCRRIQTILSGFNTSLDAYLSDDIHSDAISYNLFCIGDSASKLREGYRAATGASVPWDRLISLSDDIQHRFLDVDLLDVWRTATEDIPVLCRICDAQLAQAPD